MSNLKIYREGHPESPEKIINDKLAMADELNRVGVRYEQWEASARLSERPEQDEVIAAYRDDIERLKREEGYQTVDVVSMTPDHPQKRRHAASSWTSTATARTRCVSSWKARGCSPCTSASASTRCCAPRAT